MTQETALEILKTGANVFLTGEPGSGKTHTINRYIDYLKERDVEPAVTASTGIAATHIGGYTIHSYSGIGIKKELTSYDLEELGQKEQLVKRVRGTQVLIIEEVSMLDARVLDMVDSAFQTLRGSGEPFGGVQVVFVGDFFQLPPISKGETAMFAFHSRAWENVKPVTCYLSEQYRQEDTMFLDILSSVRHQNVTYQHRTTLMKRKAAHHETKHITATKLSSHNADVDRINNEELAKLSEKKHAFEMNSRGSKALVEQLKRGCLSPEMLELKVGAVVMFTKNNFECGYVNGTIGVVDEFDSAGWPVVATRQGKKIAVEPVDWNIEESGKVKATITQVPLRLAWAITVHKSQGMSLDAAVIDLTRAFEYGQGYVALSRVRTLDGLHLLGVNERAFEVHPDVGERDRWFREHSRVAEERFAKLSTDELKKLHTNFLTALGGRLTPRSGKEKEKKKKGKNARGIKGGTYERTRELIMEGKSVREIATERDMKPRTIVDHIVRLAEQDKLVSSDFRYLWDGSDGDLETIYDAFDEMGDETLKPVFEHLDGTYSYDALKLARALR